jgi:hypothetical protein
VRGKRAQSPEDTAGGLRVVPRGRHTANACEALKPCFFAGAVELPEAAWTYDPEGGVGSVAQSKLGELLLMIANDNSHHLGQVVPVRRLMRTWFPSSGGVTW